jgi:endonuclease/exonuclease/phosphatase family metal-dependent hydrolase
MRKAFIGLAALAVLIPALFAANGLLLAGGTRPRMGRVVAAVPPQVHHPTGAVSVVSFNIAKCFVHLGKGRLAGNSSVQARLDEVASIVRGESPDVLFLSEIAWEAGWGGINQVTYLAEHTGLTNWAFGENFCFGFPGYRVISGNAILTHHPVLKALENPDLPGRRPFFVTRNNRRVLVGEIVLHGEAIRLYSIHNDSFVPTNNLAQMMWILDHTRGHRAIMAGDFNATPQSPSLRALRQSDSFAGEWAGPPTLPNVNPDRTIDFIFGPTPWEVVRHRVLTNGASDHCAVATVFRTHGVSPAIDRPAEGLRP